MNKRLTMLAASHFPRDTDGQINATPEMISEFAEVIVRECARIAAQTPCPYEDKFAKQTYGHTWDMACVESAKDIRKHFGVE